MGPIVWNILCLFLYGSLACSLQPSNSLVVSILGLFVARNKLSYFSGKEKGRNVVKYQKKNETWKCKDVRHLHQCYSLISTVLYSLCICEHLTFSPPGRQEMVVRQCSQVCVSLRQQHGDLVLVLASIFSKRNPNFITLFKCAPLVLSV